MHSGLSPAVVTAILLLCQVFMQSPELFLAAVLCIHDCGQNDKAIYMSRKKNHPVIFCVLSSERIRSSHHLPNKSHCQKDVDIKGLKEIMGKEIRRSSFLSARTAHACFKPLCTFLPRRQCRAETKLLGFGATQIKWPAMLSPE